MYIYTYTEIERQRGLGRLETIIIQAQSFSVGILEKAELAPVFKSPFLLMILA